MLNIIKNAEDSALQVTLEGRLDTTTAPQLESQLMGSLNGVTNLNMDFEKLEYISSAGLRVLLSAHKALHGKGKMKVVNPNEIVQEVFEVTGFDNILTIE